MELEDYFILAVIFGFVAYLSIEMANNPLGFFRDTGGISALIFISSSYLAIGFAFGGAVKLMVENFHRRRK